MRQIIMNLWEGIEIETKRIKEIFSEGSDQS
jgi:hypothetical protein